MVIPGAQSGKGGSPCRLESLRIKRCLENNFKDVNRRATGDAAVRGRLENVQCTYKNLPATVERAHRREALQGGSSKSEQWMNRVIKQLLSSCSKLLKTWHPPIGGTNNPKSSTKSPIAAFCTGGKDRAIVPRCATVNNKVQLRCANAHAKAQVICSSLNTPVSRYQRHRERGSKVFSQCLCSCVLNS